MKLFYSVISVIALQRLFELFISKRNEKWILKKGGIEYGKKHYRFIVIMHILFFVSMVIEYKIKERDFQINIFNYLFLVFLIILELLRIWTLMSLGKYWNTKVYRIPGAELIRTGPYKFLRHPNYAIVAGEIFVIPMIFNLYYTAVIFSILNAAILSVRIKVENKALSV